MNNQYYTLNPTLFDELKTLVDSYPFSWHKKILASGKNKNYPSKKYLIEWINSVTPLLSDREYTIKTKIYWILNDIHDFPKCINETCHNKLIHRNVSKLTIGYKNKFCSKKCRYEVSVRKSGETCLKRYGVKTNMMTQEFKDCSKEYFKTNFGVEYPGQVKEYREKSNLTRLNKNGGVMQSDEEKQKRKQTLINRYGVDTPLKFQPFIDKSKQTCRDRYGVDYPGIGEEAMKKHRDTLLSTYGVSSYSKTDEFKEKYKRTCLEKYGVDNVLMLDDYRKKSRKTCKNKYGSETYNNREKAKSTCIEKYGVDSVGKVDEFKEISKLKRLQRNYSKLCENEFTTPLFTFDEYKNKTEDTKFKWRCNICGKEFESKIDWNFYISKYYNRKTVAKCPCCFPQIRSESYQEREFKEFIKTFTDKEVLSRQKILIDNGFNRKNKEIDVYIPELRLGFEFNGLRFHSKEFGCEINRHLDKTIMAENQGIKLIHIHSLLWKNNKEWLTSFIQSIFDNSLDIVKYSKHDESGNLIVDRMFFNKCWNISGYECIGETEAQYEILQDYRNRIFSYPTCGKLIYRRIV